MWAVFEFEMRFRLRYMMSTKQTRSEAGDGQSDFESIVAREDQSRVPSHIVGIGASAGGLESLERVFTNMPGDTGMAFVIIQHLSPDFKSLMDELLARYTSLPIHRAEEGMVVESDSVYLIPPKKEMIVSNGRLLLTDKDPKQPLTMPIDRFFRSLARDAGDRAVGVILSGTGSDGSRGICDIHEAGGLVICETKETAKFDGMPQAALETGIVDRVMPAESIPQTLVNYKLELPFGDKLHQCNEAPPEAIDAVFELLNESCGIDFSHYKSNTVSRRIQRRLSMIGVRTLEDYVERLRTDDRELNALYKDLLIGVTRFFRDRDAFSKLESELIPDLVRKADEEEEVRIWVAGCATGEEAYSLAMLIHEQLEKADQPINVKIFATDVHRASLDIAGAGVYSEESLADVRDERLERYFDKKRDGYHVVPDLRQMIVFAAHNVMCDAPFTKLDLITCRNLLIYFQPTAQRKALSLFHFGLKTGGWLFLGPSESPGELLEELEVTDSHWKIYQKRRDARLPSDMEVPLANPLKPVRRTPISMAPQPSSVFDTSLLGAYDAMLDRYMPPALLINEQRELLHAFGGAARYLKLKSGRPSSDILTLFDRELRNAVTGAVQRVLRENRPVSYTGVRAEENSDGPKLRITVEPVDNPRSRLAQLLIRFEEIEVPATSGDAKPSASADEDMQQMSADRIETLEGELRYSKENLQATIEELETSNEEMQATNEELVASNEELQSTNEELQSVNEELYTVNAEYQKKIAELSELTSDMDNLLESTEIGTIFLDRELHIRKFTPQIGQEFHLLPQDIGRPINSFAHNIEHPELLDDLAAVVESETPREREVQDRQGKWLYLRILPYRTKAKKVDGVVLTLVDISPVKKAQQELANAVRRRDEFLAMLSHELRNPLGAILNATHVVKKLEIQEGVVRESLNVVRRQGRHMSRLLDDLLDVSRVTQNKIELHLGQVEVRSIIENAVDAAGPLMQSGNLNFDQNISEEPMQVYGDEARLQQALSNLLANAARYTPKGGDVALEAFRENGDVVFRVKDTGAGIPPEQTESIFDLFVQSEHTLDRSNGGMGIGLTLVRSIAEMHEGNVSVASDGVDRGSTFELRLPVIDAATSESDDHDQPEPFVVPTSASGGRIVIVEDQKDAREMLKALLTLEGYDVHAGENGIQGLAVIDQIRPDVALVDIGLPGIDGYELARQVRNDQGNDHTHLVALTGYGQPGDVEAALEAGFDSHLVKPLDFKKLADILENHSNKNDGKNDETTPEPAATAETTEA